MSCRVFRSLAEAKADCAPSVLTIGNFDGVHIGHCVLFQRVIETARRVQCSPSALTFDPHPTRVVAPARAPKLLTTPEQRIQLIANAGIEQIFLLPFDTGFAQLTAEQFVREILVDSLKARAVIIGDNFRFGHRQTGDTNLLHQLGKDLGFTVDVVPAIAFRGQSVSSTAVRQALQQGDVSRATRLLARPYRLEGVVVSGHGIGRKQTVPTLNLQTTAEVLPANGVYVTRTIEAGGDERAWQSITNVGTRPTFDNSPSLTIETFLLEPLNGPDPSNIAVEFLHRIRDEKKFESPDMLKQQILHDVERAKVFHRRTSRLGVTAETV